MTDSAFGRVQVACVASVSNRVIARKLERKQKNGSPSPVIQFSFCSCPSFLDEPREETLATQARVQVSSFVKGVFPDGQQTR